MRKTEPFTKIPNSLITELPPILLKLYSYIKSRPEGWIFHSRGTANALDYSARLYHKSLKQLLDRGLIEKSRERRANGQLGCVTIRIKEAMFTESKQGETNNASAMFTQTKLSDTKLSDTKLSDTKHSESPQLVRLNNKKTNNKKRVRLWYY